MESSSALTFMDILGQVLKYTPIVVLFLCVALYAAVVRKKLWPTPGSGSYPSTPLLFSYALTGSDTDLISVPGGTTPNGMHFEFYATNISLFSTQQTYGIYCIELPFTSGVHLIGAPKAGDTQLDFSGVTSLEPVTLEGTYNQVFNLYAEHDQQVQSRYVLDPAAMVFTLDFCSKFNWEILGDTLYFMDTDHLPTFEIVDEFVAQIRPTIEIPSDRRKNPYKMSYTQMSGRIFLCPICQKQLVTGDAWLACPNGHGCLVSGKQMINLKKEGAEDPPDTATAAPHGNLTCPYCQNPMVPTRYQETNITIDVCSKCMFRWLDATEPTALFKTKIPSLIEPDL